LKSSNKLEDLIEIGKIVGAHGINGVVKVYSYAESVDCFTACGQLTVIDHRGQRQTHKALWAKQYKSIVRLALASVGSRNAAEAMAGHRVLIPRKCLPLLEEEAYYWADLIGMDVFTNDEDYLGRVAEIIPTGANDVYVVRTLEGSPVKEILIPAIASVVLDIDVAHQRMRVELPDGLIESTGS
jgi:16S rRNA processing protein RimM